MARSLNKKSAILKKQNNNNKRMGYIYRKIYFYLKVVLETVWYQDSFYIMLAAGLSKNKMTG